MSGSAPRRAPRSASSGPTGRSGPGCMPTPTSSSTWSARAGRSGRGDAAVHEEARSDMTTPRLADIGLPPDFGEPGPCPELPAARYPERIEQLRARMAGRGYDRLVVWADREHSAGLSFLTGFDPRFEEAILVLGPDGDPAILVRHECWGTAGA